MQCRSVCLMLCSQYLSELGKLGFLLVSSGPSASVLSVSGSTWDVLSPSPCLICEFLFFFTSLALRISLGFVLWLDLVYGFGEGPQRSESHPSDIRSASTVVRGTLPVWGGWGSMCWIIVFPFPFTPKGKEMRLFPLGERIWVCRLVYQGC